MQRHCLCQSGLRLGLGLSTNTSLAAPGALPHRLQSGTACQIQNGNQGASKWPTVSAHPRIFAALNNFCQKRLIYPSTPSSKKGHDGKKGEKRREKKYGNSGH